MAETWFQRFSGVIGYCDSKYERHPENIVTFVTKKNGRNCQTFGSSICHKLDSNWISKSGRYIVDVAAIPGVDVKRGSTDINTE